MYSKKQADDMIREIYQEESVPTLVHFQGIVESFLKCEADFSSRRHLQEVNQAIGRRVTALENRGGKVAESKEEYNVVDISETAEYTNKFYKIMGEIGKLARGAKTNDYGETWKRLGLVGIYVKIFIKEGRLSELIWHKKEQKVKGESVRDTLLDLAAYAIYGIICLDENNIDGAEAKTEHSASLKAEMIEALKRGM